MQHSETMHLHVDAACQGPARRHHSNQSVPVCPSDSDTAGYLGDPTHWQPAIQETLCFFTSLLCGTYKTNSIEYVGDACAQSSDCSSCVKPACHLVLLHTCWLVKHPCVVVLTGQGSKTKAICCMVEMHGAKTLLTTSATKPAPASSECNRAYQDCDYYNKAYKDCE